MKYRIKTEASDVYYVNTDMAMSRGELANWIWEKEGKCADLDFYLETIDVEEIPKDE